MSGHTKGTIHIGVFGLYSDSPEVTNILDIEANYPRMRDCWNACDGINPEAVGEMRKALERIASFVDMPTAQIAKDALAKAEEDQ
ncbi:MAG: hypothetical protein ACR2PS_00270 [Pseudomonadales bacterium]